MKLVTLTAADLERLRQSLPDTAAQATTLQRDEIAVDALSIARVRPSGSDDPRTDVYSIGFRCGDSDYALTVRPSVHETPSITLDIIQRASDKNSESEFASYTVLSDQVTVLKGTLPGMLPTPIIDREGGKVTARVDLKAILKLLKVK